LKLQGYCNIYPSREILWVIRQFALFAQANSMRALLKLLGRSAWQRFMQARGVASPMWGGIFVVEPGRRTGIHHHGEQDTIVYVLEGSSNVRWGERGEASAIVHAGDFLFVPAWLPHQEINPSNEAPFRWVVVRSTSAPIVVNLPDDYWQRSESA
jgi:uncharacterized RmlC-like cupin family protein